MKTLVMLIALALLACNELPPEGEGDGDVVSDHGVISDDGGGGDLGVPPGGPGCSVDGWCWVDPLPQGNPLRAVWGAAANDVWAVGDAGAIIHYDGSAWRAASSPVTANLNGVWGSAAHVVWAVG